MTRTGNNKHDEPEITVDTPTPISVEPPIVTTCVATPINVVTDQLTINETSASSPRAKPATCTVFAPATLSAGYTFPARVDGIDFVVTVPEGGVVEGQAFQVPYPTTPASPSIEQPMLVAPLELATPHPIPTGMWRNDICSCCEVIHTGIFWQALFCTPLLLGQILTRNHLNPLDLPKDCSMSYFALFAGIWVFSLLLWLLVVLGVIPTRFAFVAWPLVTAVLTSLTRFSVRRKYHIPVKCCDCCAGSFDDVCCGIWCACCVSIQMARHTHPHHEFPYECCSSTGLRPGTPEIV